MGKVKATPVSQPGVTACHTPSPAETPCPACWHDEECHAPSKYAPDVLMCRVKRCRCKKPVKAEEKP